MTEPTRFKRGQRCPTCGQLAGEDPVSRRLGKAVGVICAVMAMVCAVGLSVVIGFVCAAVVRALW
jgi:hypothetical protein